MEDEDNAIYHLRITGFTHEAGKTRYEASGYIEGYTSSFPRGIQFEFSEKSGDMAWFTIRKFQNPADDAFREDYRWEDYFRWTQKKEEIWQAYLHDLEDEFLKKLCS